MSSPDVSSGACSPLRLAANRRNAQKSTGPRTDAGKRRVGLNALKRDLCPPDLEKLLRVRGQDPREFSDLHRDLIAILQPRSKASFAAVLLLAEAWWEKACRIRSWVGAGPPITMALDIRLEELIQFVMYTKQVRREPWRTELTSVLGRRPLPTPEAVRMAIEERLPPFGAKLGRRMYPVIPQMGALIWDFFQYREARSRAREAQRVRPERSAGVSPASSGAAASRKTNPNKPIEVNSG